MQCGALILCFAAPAPVIDDSYHVCRPSIDFFFSFSFAGERVKVAAAVPLSFSFTELGSRAALFLVK